MSPPSPTANPGRQPTAPGVSTSPPMAPSPRGQVDSEHNRQADWPLLQLADPPNSGTAQDVRTPSVADFYAVNRGGGLFSEGVSQWIGARIAVGARKRRLAPSVLTVANLSLGCAVSLTVLATAEPIAAGQIWAWPIGLLALIGWQVAYALDCADGQLARVTEQATVAGGRLDVLCDVAVQISLVAALAATAEAQVDKTPGWLLAAFAGTWMVNLLTSVMQSGAQATSMITSRSRPVRVLKLVRDYGAVITVAGAVLVFAPQWTIWFVAVFTVVNAAFLAASVVYSAREALRH